ncbi:MAG TPA: tryptophan--tRNA ligase [Candidatus Bilamarchaeaceae archaeon]|nr:tryptophan--tRNA ligase [Candidatus Bilamarchaeaceae archaeon]
MEFEVTPWEVKGEVDYEKLIRRFGTKKITEDLRQKIKKHTKELDTMLRRDYFFSHRDLDLVLNDWEKGEGFFLYTGRGPSGPMHIGHLVPLIFTKWLQEKFGVNLYIEITDDEKYWVKDCEWKDVQKYSDENIKDIAAVGFDPEKTFIFKDSEYIRNVYPILVRAAKKITNSTAKAVFGFSGDTNIGLNFYPAYQTVPTFFEKKRCLIPCAIDQDPYWRVQRDIAEKIGYKKTAAIHSKFLPPLTGIDGKMSASDADTAIWLEDDEKAVKKKINKYAFSGGKTTIEEHRRLGGDPNVDVSFQWLKILFENDDNKLKKIETEYLSGKLLSGELKQILIEKINLFLTEHRKRKEKIDVEKFTKTGALAKKMWGSFFI